MRKYYKDSADGYYASHLADPPMKGLIEITEAEYRAANPALLVDPVIAG